MLPKFIALSHISTCSISQSSGVEDLKEGRNKALMTDLLNATPPLFECVDEALGPVVEEDEMGHVKE